MDKGLIDGILHIFDPITSGIGAWIRKWPDLWLINEKIGDGLADITQEAGRTLRPIQTGRIQQYMLFSLVILVIVGAILYFTLGVGL